MKLFEIINTQYKDYNDDDNDIDDDSNIVGSGHFAHVRSDKDPHIVNKYYHNSPHHISNDPYYIYIKTIADNNLASQNPYFPRIYEVLKDKNLPQYKMEKLQSYTNFNDEVFLQIGKNIINNFLENYNERCVSAGWKISYYTAIRQIISKSLNHNNFTDIKDPNLKQALKVIMNVKNQTDTEYDISPDNIMMRLSKYGPQLVFTDPIA